MYNFFPERIYKILKDEEIYKKWDTIVNASKTANNINFRQSLTGDYNIKQTDDYKNFIKEISELINEKCPEYKDQFLIVYLDLNKKDLLSLYNDCKFDTETTLFLLSRIIDTSYIDRDFQQYINQYVITYESIATDDRINYSTYCSIKYFLLAPEKYMLSIDKNSDFLSSMITYIKNLRTEMSSIIDSDTLNQCYLQVVDHMIANSLYYINDDSIVAKNLDDLDLEEDTVETQYKDYSMSRAGIKDKKFEVYFANRQYLDAFVNMKWLFNYINKALESPTTFFKGLEYYDKINNYPMAAIIRRMLKIQELFPDLEFSLSNLDSEDKTFLLQSDLASVTPANHVVKTTFGNFVKHMDDWLSGNDYSIDKIKSYNMSEFKTSIDTAYTTKFGS